VTRNIAGDWSTNGGSLPLGKRLRNKLVIEMSKERAKVETQITHMLSEAGSRLSEAGSRLSEAGSWIMPAKAKALANVGAMASDVGGAIVSRLTDKEVTTDELRTALTRRAGGVGGA
jgi:hypothetical protein